MEGQQQEEHHQHGEKGKAQQRQNEQGEEGEQPPQLEPDESEFFVLLRAPLPQELALHNPLLRRVICSYLQARDVISLALTCSGTIQAASDEQIWAELLRRLFPKATLTNPDLQRREQDQQNQRKAAREQLLEGIEAHFPSNSQIHFSELLLFANRFINEEQQQQQEEEQQKEEQQAAGVAPEREEVPRQQQLGVTVAELSQALGFLRCLKQSPDGWDLLMLNSQASPEYASWGAFNSYQTPAQNSPECLLLQKQVQQQLQQQQEQKDESCKRRDQEDASSSHVSYTNRFSSTGGSCTGGGMKSSSSSSSTIGSSRKLTSA
ncbi:hypothetical protein Esti_004872 [Eimeria stiedai]